MNETGPDPSVGDERRKARDEVLSAEQQLLAQLAAQEAQGGPKGWKEKRLRRRAEKAGYPDVPLAAGQPERFDPDVELAALTDKQAADAQTAEEAAIARARQVLRDVPDTVPPSQEVQNEANMRQGLPEAVPIGEAVLDAPEAADELDMAHQVDQISEPSKLKQAWLRVTGRFRRG